MTVIPGGVNSPVRAFRGVGGIPRFIERGQGSRIFDTDGNSYIDYVNSWGPLLLGHRPQPVIDALREALEAGTSFGAPTEREVELAELIFSKGSRRPVKWVLAVPKRTKRGRYRLKLGLQDSYGRTLTIVRTISVPSLPSRPRHARRRPSRHAG